MWRVVGPDVASIDELPDAGRAVEQIVYDVGSGAALWRLRSGELTPLV